MMAIRKRGAMILGVVGGMEFRSYGHEMGRSKRWLLASPCGNTRSELLEKQHLP